MAKSTIIAADIGNSAVTLGRFETSEVDAAALPLPLTSLSLQSPTFDTASLTEWLPAEPVKWLLASVNRAGLAEFAAWISEHRSGDSMRQITHADVPLRVEVDAPERVGIDRLCAAAAAVRRQPAGRACVVVDSGTAITVDAVSAAGAFLGGAILPGYRLAAQSLSEGTDALPPLPPLESTPAPIGRHTEAAIHSGLHWGLVGAVKELVEQIGAELGGDYDVVATGGDAERLAAHVHPQTTSVPHLTLAGIALAAGGMDE